ncbi:DNA-binding protein, partial [Nadsonia fulvescens var. elongata DSM 6958]
TNSVVTLAQSEELMQTLLSTSFSCLTYLRGLFVDENFYDEKFTVKSPGTNTSFDSSQGYVSSSQKSRDAIRIKKLKRGVSSEGDLFLDWIERGVFDAFHRKYLKALMFTIYLNSQKPSEIVELYTFSFSYNNKDNMLLQTEGRIVSVLQEFYILVTNQPFLISPLDIRRDIQALIRKFIMIVQSLAPLPERRFLSMKLVYNESAPEEYQPPFFRDCSNETDTQFMVHQNEDICTLKAGCVDAGFHAISVNVASIVDS